MEPRRSQGSQIEECYASPQVSQATADAFPYPTKPDRRIRSNKGCSNDEGQEEPDGFINEDLRDGGPYLCSLPAVDGAVDLAGWEHLHSDHGQRVTLAIYSMLDSVKIDVDGVTFLTRKAMFDAESTPRVTAYISARGKMVGDDTWLNTSRKILGYLRKQGLGDDVSVEIIDTRPFEHDRFEAVEHTDAIHPVWDDVCREILDACDITNWIILSCVRLSRHGEEKSHPTVLVTVDKTVDGDWRPARDTIAAILDRRGLNTVAVKFRRDAIAFRPPGLRDDELAPAALDGPVRVGYSLALRDSLGGGTLGGWIELQDPDTDQWRKFGITCSRCVLPEGSIDTERWHRDGLYLSSETNTVTKLELDSPSSEDLQSHFNWHDKKIKETLKDPSFISRQTTLDNGGFLSSTHEKIHQMKNEILAVCEAEKQKVNTFRSSSGHRLGHVFAASSQRAKPAVSFDSHLPTIMDWALIDVLPNRIGDNKILSLGPTDIFHFKVAFEDAGLRVRRDKIRLSNKEQVYKCGKSTRYTIGQYSDLKVVRIIKRTINGTEATLPTMEHQIFDLPNSRYFPSSFSSLGDAGSFVFSQFGELLGLLLGGTERGGFALFTHIADLMEDIKAVTGAKGFRAIGDD